MNSIDNTESDGSPAIVKSRSETVDTQQSSEAVSLDSRLSDKPETPTTARENHIETPTILENRSEVVSPATIQEASETFLTESSSEFFSEGQKVESLSSDSMVHDTSTKEEEMFSQAQETDASSTTKDSAGTTSVSPFEDAEDVEVKKEQEDKEKVKVEVEEKEEEAKEKEEVKQKEQEKEKMIETEVEETKEKDETVEKREAAEELKEEVREIDDKEEAKEKDEETIGEKEVGEGPIQESNEESKTTNEESDLVRNEIKSTEGTQEDVGDPKVESSTEETPTLEEVTSESQVSVLNEIEPVKEKSEQGKADEECSKKSLNCSTSVMESAETSQVEIRKSETLENSTLVKEVNVVEGESAVIIGNKEGSEEEVNAESTEPSNISTSLSDTTDLMVRTNAEEVTDSVCNNSDVQSSVDNVTQVPNSVQQIPTITTVCDDTKSLQDGVPENVSSNLVARDNPLPNGSSSPEHGDMRRRTSFSSVHVPEEDVAETGSGEPLSLSGPLRQNSSPQKRPRSASTSTQVDPNHFG